ncbi:hypothetical protein [Spongiibacter tropicus]|uniref:hypothetical protein n=1 Tax=Spongiibacter tropicus TaxID=454602 RepID=UPI0003B3581A|nr:hypothetical protein [Spongiibacter tropicus]
MHWAFRKDHIENWFKWLEWVTLTAAIGAAYWETKSNWVLPIVLLSFAYVWHTAMCGSGYVLGAALSGFNLEKNTIENVARILGSFIVLFAFLVLVLLFIGLFKLGGS